MVMLGGSRTFREEVIGTLPSEGITSFSMTLKLVLKRELT